MADTTKSKPDLAKLAELKREFGSVPAPRSWSNAPCPNGCGTLSERDQVGPGVACFDVTTMYYCDVCGYHEIGETYWTTDY
jgi:hypothetical protein